VLASEQDARSRNRLRDILLGFGARGRESVQPLMNSTNWEVRRTAALLLREFGGSEGLKELIPLLADSEPLVQREAVQGLMFNGTEAAAKILLGALTSATGRSRETLISELGKVRDERAGPVFAYLLRRVDRRALQPVYLSAIEALGSAGGTDAVGALTFALMQGDWWAPMRTRRLREAAAASLARLGTPEAIEALRTSAARAPRGVRSAAKAQLSRID
jgi:HEAT repeat protein